MIPQASPVLVFDPAGAVAPRLATALGRPFAILPAATVEDACTTLGTADVALAFVAGRDATARHLLAEIARRCPGAVRIALADAEDPEIFALEAAGAELCLPETAPDTALRLTARHARSLYRLRRAHDTGLDRLGTRAAPAVRPTLRQRVARLEADVLRETMVRLGGNKSRAADELGLSRVGLRAKLVRYGIGSRATAAARQR